MYPSINNNGNISFTSINVQPKTLSFENDVNLSKLPQEHYCCPPSSSSFHLFSPHYITLEEHETIYNDDHLPQQQNLFSHDHNNHHHTNNNIVVHEQQYSNLQSAMKKCSTNNEKFVVKNGDYGDKDGFDSHLEPKNRRITFKKDRHSKINTARGPRDRRMRLSIDVAKKFFKLQDMLGFDKASKTVEWLLMKSKSGIQELLIPSKLNVSNTSASSTTTSNCELVLSGNIDNQCMVVGKDQVTAKFQVKSSFSTNCKEKKKSGRKVRKSAHFHSPLAKETREKARARARERTVEKISKLIGSSGGDHNQCSKSRPCLDQVMDQYLHLIGPSSTIDQLEEQSSNLQFSKQGISGDDSSLMTANWSPTFLFNYQHAEALLQEQQFNEFQILGNLWEGND